MTLFFVTHDLEEAVYLGTRIIALSQHYSDDRLKDQTHPRGSEIVSDFSLRKIAKSSTIKKDPKFLKVIQDIRKEGFDPEHLQHVTDFNYTHPDSFQTLTNEEVGGS